MLLAAQMARAQEGPEILPGTALRPSPALQAPASRTSDKLPVILQADQIRARPDLDAVAEGHVELRRGGTVIRADRLSYDNADDLAKARGNVRISQAGNVFSGPEVQLHLQRFEGYFDQPDYFFAATQAGGHAQRIDFLGDHRIDAVGATYTSCPRDGSGDPPWLLSSDRVKMDFDTNTGVAEGAVLRFYGVPILGAPVMSFPLSDARKSGLLPPLMNFDTKSGFVVGVPYYWNIAPNRDATFTPTVMTRRGFALDTEFRYLEPSFHGLVDLNVLPDDRVSHETRRSLQLQHEGDTLMGLHYQANLLRVSDDAYWKDFPRSVPSLTPRLLALDALADRGFTFAGSDWLTYARVQRWQVLNNADPTSLIDAPYERSPQVGVRGSGRVGGWAGNGLEYSLETEVNRFTLPDTVNTAGRLTGDRWHALGSLSWPVSIPGGWLTPRLTVNAASYATDQAMSDGRRRASRVIPTFSVDSGFVFERDSRWFGQPMRQTLEPRLLYVNTPYRNQSSLPNFDAVGKDFNDISVYSENAFAGVDRVSDAHQLTAGVTTRWLDAKTGAETMRLGIAQRYLFRTQQITPSTEGGLTTEGGPTDQRFSDVLLLASSTLIPHWTVDGSLQYSPDSSRVSRSLMGVRYSPGPFRTVSMHYRYTRNASEQVDVGWQWPIYGPARKPGSGGGGSCTGSWYSVGWLNYNKRDSRLTDSLIGLEYDAGCWIGRVVAERVSTGRTEATTRVGIQLEFVGLSKLNLGANPLKVLKDNIAGYRLLREERTEPSASQIYD